MALVVDRHLELYRSNRFFSAFPSVVTLPGGEILLAFRRAPDHRWLFGELAEEDLNSVDHVHFKSHIALRRFSADMNKACDATAMPMHSEAGDQDANLFVHSCGRLFQHGFLWYPVTIETATRLKNDGRHVLMSEHYGAGYLFWGGYVRYSDDDGHSWSDYVELPVNREGDTAKGPYVKGTVAVRGRMAETPDGGLTFAAYTAGIRDNERQQTRFFRSDTCGENWSLLAQQLSMDGVDLQEPSMAAWPKGKFTVFHRTRLNEDRLVVATTGKDGSFGKPKTLNITGHPYDPLVLPDGRLLLVYGYRHEPMGVRARIVTSLDELALAEEIIIRDDSSSRDTGYPSAAILSDGRILVAYYMADSRGIRGIDGTILKFE